MNLLTNQIVREARKHLGVRETARNSGPEIDGWLLRVKRFPGAPWCCAFAWCMLDDACHALGLENPIEPVAGVHLLRQLARERRALTDDVGPGMIYLIDHGIDKDGHRLGHCGIAVEVGDDELAGIEGNTNAAGSREGNCVALKTRRLSEVSLGYLDPGRLFA